MEKNDIILIHGTNYKVMAKKVMEAANVAEDIGDKKKKIALKPNLVTCRSMALKTSPSWKAPGLATAPVKRSALPATTWSAAVTTSRSWICSATPGRSTMPQA